MLGKIWDWFYNLSYFQWSRAFVQDTTGLDGFLKGLIAFTPPFVGFWIIIWLVWKLFCAIAWLSKNIGELPRRLKRKFNEPTPDKTQNAPTPPKSVSPAPPQNLHPMVFIFDSPLCTGGTTIEKLGISGNRVDIFEPSTMLNKASLDVERGIFKIPFEEDDLQDFEYYEEPTNLLFQNLKYAISLFWYMQRELEESNEDECDEADIEELEKYSNTIWMYLDPKGIRARITETGWSFEYNDTYITLEEVIRIVYAGKLKPTKDEGRKTSIPTPLQSQPRPSTPAPAQQAPTPPPKAPSKPKLSIEEELLNYLKAQPICWEFPLTTQDKALNQFCEALVFNDNVAAASSNEAIRNLELTIQKKRARNPRLADHNAAMEGNILAMLYEYSYLMHIFHALDDMKFDTTKVDISKLWLLIQQDCNARINNLDVEKIRNPRIQAVLNKYNYDNQITRLKVLDDATGREMDYIIIFIMAYSLLTVISLLLGNPKLLQPLKPYSANDIAGMMNALINTSAGLRFTAYSR